MICVGGALCVCVRVCVCVCVWEGGMGGLWCVCCNVNQSASTMSQITHINESCHTYERVMSHIRMGHVTRMNELRHGSCHTYERVMYVWVMSHIRMSHVGMGHVTHMNESWHTYE